MVRIKFELSRLINLTYSGQTLPPRISGESVSTATLGENTPKIDIGVGYTSMKHCPMHNIKTNYFLYSQLLSLSLSFS